MVSPPAFFMQIVPNYRAGGVPMPREDARFAARRKRGCRSALQPRGEWADQVAPDWWLAENRGCAGPA